ncbi:uncharacterized protein B0T15DRAFT_483712 [Chaetomium strumarium]|uniref:Rhodopsin domain-containing protein n=1 Tax=Chaetomium strumarium TaxID=1170767 RepID=A0AAJ0M257_9PEZI|nr:hypothetical protein B0T15DRAFT_483712 [Chaetomium strumarium]
MRFPPPEVIASWPTPNYTDPATRGPALIIIESIFLAVSVACVGLRLYVRMGTMSAKVELDDWLMVAAETFAIGVTTCVLLAYDRYGWDMHVWDLSIDTMVAGRQISFAVQALFILATCLAKISILVSYLRLSPKNSRFRRMTFVGIWWVALSSVTFFIFLFAQCSPLSSYWDLLRNAHDCTAEGPPLIAHAATTICSDFLVWVLPLPSLYRAKLPLSQRLALIVLFSVGLLVVFAACIRTYWVHYVVDGTYDITWEGFNLWLWTAVEVQLGVICGCVPWLKALVKFWRSRNTVVDLTDTWSPTVGQRTRSDRGRSMTCGEAAGSIAARTDSVGKDGNESSEEFPDLESGSNTVVGDHGEVGLAV